MNRLKTTKGVKAMMFVKPERFEITLVRSRGDDNFDEVLICEIDENYEVAWHAPIDLFLPTRNMAVIYGFGNDGRVVSKEFMQVGTKRQEWAGWFPILSSKDFERMIDLKIRKEKSKAESYKENPKCFSFYRGYA